MRIIRNISCFLAVSGGLLVGGSSLAAKPTYEIYTAILPPYTESIPKTGPLTGYVSEVVQEALAAAGLQLTEQPKEMPWKRAQELGKERANSLIFPFARTPLREPNYKWITVAVNDAYYAYTRSDAPTLGSYEVLKSVPRLGVNAGSAGESKAKELSLGVILDPANSDLANFEKLVLNRVDAVLGQAALGTYFSAMPQISGKVHKGAKLEDIPLWVATSPQTSDEAIALVRNAIDDFKKTARYAEITKNYQ